MSYFENIVNKWSHKVKSGMPDINNFGHKLVLRQVLLEEGWDIRSANTLIDSLVEADDKDDYVHLSRGIYVKSGDEDKEGAQKYKKTDDGKFEPIEGEETPEEEPSQKLSGPEDFERPDTEEKPSQEQSKVERQQELRDKDDDLVETQLRLKKGDPQDKGGQGTPESRTGETVTVWAGKKVQQLMKDGMSYEDAREQVRKELLEIAGEKDALLTKEWVESGLSCLDWIEENYGLDNIEDIAWDTPEGNELVGSTGHGTSADMFIKTKDGKTIGVSLKKDFKVFIVNGGFDTQIKNVAKMLGIDVEDLPENIRPGYYIKRRGEVLKDGVPKLNEPKVKQIILEKFGEALRDEEAAKKLFGKAWKKRIDYVAARKAGISLGKFKKLSTEEQQKLIDSLTADDLYDHVINASPLKGEDIKVIANIANIDEVNEVTNLYTDLRNLDEEMADNLMDFLNEGENLEKFKELVSKETHIDDILFGSEGDGLDKLEVLYGEKGGVSMSPEAIVNLFDIGDLYEQWKNAEGEEREELKKQIQEKIREKMVVMRDRGKPVIAVRVQNPNPPPSESILPIFGMATRTKGIGSSNGLEIYQSAFGSLAFKNGNVDIDNWPDEDKKKVVNDQVKGILNDIEDENINPETDEGMEELKERIELLERWDPNNKLLKKLKDRFGL